LSFLGLLWLGAWIALLILVDVNCPDYFHSRVDWRACAPVGVFVALAITETAFIGFFLKLFLKTLSFESLKNRLFFLSVVTITFSVAAVAFMIVPLVTDDCGWSWNCAFSGAWFLFGTCSMLIGSGTGIIGLIGLFLKSIWETPQPSLNGYSRF
jgi:hypothetical protein